MRGQQLAVVAIVVLALAAATRRGGSGTVPAVSTPLAATVNGLSVPMSSYQRLLRSIERSYSGPPARSHSPTAHVLSEMQQNQAVNQAIAETLIDHMAAVHHLSATSVEISAELALMAQQAGGAAALALQATAAALSDADLRELARHTVLRDRLAQLLNDPGWLNTQTASATISYRVGHNAVASIQPSITLGAPAPLFVAANLSGNAVSTAELGNRPIVLAFFATNCGWCLADLSVLNQYARVHPQVAVVALDRGEDPAKVQAFRRTQMLSYLSIWLDQNGHAAADYTVDQLPVTFFIDRTGTIRSYNFGPLGSMQSLSDQVAHAVHGVNNTE